MQKPMRVSTPSWQYSSIVKVVYAAGLILLIIVEYCKMERNVIGGSVKP
jgi:hypothetical protein